MPFYISRKAYKENLAKQVVFVTDQTISKIGAEIHDDLIQKLSVFRLYIDRIERSAEYPADIRTTAINMRVDFEKVIASVRSISRQLFESNVYEDEGYIGRLSRLCQNLERPGIGHVHFNCDCDDPLLSTEVQNHTIRIVQELVNNAFKHSAAWHIWVSIRKEGNQFVIEVEDDGNSDAVQHIIRRLKNKNSTLKLRAELINASMSFLNGGSGLVARLSIPLPSRAHKIPFR